MTPLARNIRVATIFEQGGTIRPVWFEWNRQRYQVRQTTYRWSEASGRATILHFAVSDDANLFELAYNTLDHTWSLSSSDATAR